jgi:hypothetical protein
MFSPSRIAQAWSVVGTSSHVNSPKLIDSFHSHPSDPKKILVAMVQIMRFDVKHPTEIYVSVSARHILGCDVMLLLEGSFTAHSHKSPHRDHSQGL